MRAAKRPVTDGGMPSDMIRTRGRRPPLRPSLLRRARRPRPGRRPPAGLDVRVQPLPALLHNRPELIAPAVKEALDEHDVVAVAYADCGTYGALDEVLGDVPRLEGAHCYDVLAGPHAQAALEEEPGHLPADRLPGAHVRAHRAARARARPPSRAARRLLRPLHPRALARPAPDRRDARGRRARRRPSRPPAGGPGGRRGGARAPARGAAELDAAASETARSRPPTSRRRPAAARSTSRSPRRRAGGWRAGHAAAENVASQRAGLRPHDRRRRQPPRRRDRRPRRPRAAAAAQPRRRRRRAAARRRRARDRARPARADGGRRRQPPGGRRSRSPACSPTSACRPSATSAGSAPATSPCSRRSGWRWPARARAPAPARLEVGAGDALPLMSSNAATFATAALVMADLWDLLEAGLGVAALSFQALRGNREAFADAVAEARPLPGITLVSARLRALTAGAEPPARRQDPFGLRCLPPVAGALAWALSGLARRARRGDQRGRREPAVRGRRGAAQRRLPRRQLRAGARRPAARARPVRQPVGRPPVAPDGARPHRAASRSWPPTTRAARA